ncbi:MAG: alkaline phosphatase family protein [Gemmataceae bacterium]|jgi:predicted AlkP superfamily pyrophosphatase or phosphodiesterase|nr:alkaline phosphatase family protein [Gemmataceae bacterium]
MKRILLTILFGLWINPIVGAEPERPKLVVLVLFDQMRGDYLSRWEKHFTDDGFKRIMTQGSWFTECHYPYGVTTTGPGHASIMTGTSPDVHGIINNSWYDRKSGKTVNCAQSPRYKVVSDKPAKPVEEKTDPKGSNSTEKSTTEKAVSGSPDYLEAPTVGDAMHSAGMRKSKIIGISYKDRSALFPVGRRGYAYWLDNDMTLITSTYYRETLPPWASEFNKLKKADAWFGKDWNRFLPDLDYTADSGPDFVIGEGKGSKQGITFPHPMGFGEKTPGKVYYEALYNSPFGNDYLFEIFKEVVIKEELGQDEFPDLLTVSFSSNDIVGHCWGPDSQEVMDTTIRSDRMFAQLLKFLDEKVGAGKYLLAVTADHGICPLPEVSEEKNLDAGRWMNTKYTKLAESHLREKFDPKNLLDEKQRFIEATSLPWYYLNEKVLEQLKLDKNTVAEELAQFLLKCPGVYGAYPASKFTDDTVTDPHFKRMKRSYFPSRSGDVCLLLKPYWLPGGDSPTASGTTHGSPYRYDTHVPLILYGTNIKAGIHKTPVTPQAIAPIFAKALGIAPPAKCDTKCPESIWRE